jgi:hypothetical protein
MHQRFLQKTTRVSVLPRLPQRTPPLGRRTLLSVSVRHPESRADWRPLAVSHRMDPYRRGLTREAPGKGVVSDSTGYIQKLDPDCPHGADTLQTGFRCAIADKVEFNADRLIESSPPKAELDAALYPYRERLPGTRLRATGCTKSSRSPRRAATRPRTVPRPLRMRLSESQDQSHSRIIPRLSRQEIHITKLMIRGCPTIISVGSYL